MTGIQKQNINVNFTQGIDQKSDPKQIPVGKFKILRNTIFDKMGLLQKRFGAKVLTTVTDASTLATLNDGLVAIGTSLTSISSHNQLTNAGEIQPLKLETKSLVRSATSQTTVDAAVEPNGLVCSVWLDSDLNSYYQISDSLTGQTVTPKVQLPATATMVRVNVVGMYFIITYIEASTTNLDYIAVPIVSPTFYTPPTTLSTQVNTANAGYDAIFTDNYLYVTWVSDVAGNAVKITTLSPQLAQGAVVTVAGETADLLSISADMSQASIIIWISMYNATAQTIRAVAYNSSLTGQVLTPTTVVSTVTINEIVSVATNGNLTIFYEVDNTYTYPPNAKTDYVEKNTLTLGGTVGTPVIILRSVGLASKAKYVNDIAYMLVTYGGAYQPTYFLIDEFGNIISKLAYSNGGGYAVDQILPSINVTGSTLQIGYLFKDLLAAVNKEQGVANVNGVYSQTGINLATFTLNNKLTTSEIGNNLHMTGGFVWMYDGVKAVEHGFHVWPEDVAVTTSAAGGLITAQTYFYAVVYEWTDNEGNIHRSAPSVPEMIVTTGATSSNTVNIPYLRLTYKTANKVRLVIYRWSTAQQNYYRVTSITNPILNNPTMDSVAYVDTLADSAILGNDLIYTTGGVIENIASPGASDMALFKSRMFIIDSEDEDLLWYSKQVIQNTPVEFSDLFTIFVAPTTGAQGSTGKTKVISAMDDKLIIFKKDAIYYITGTGPDNTGANNDFSDPIFITSTVGCDNPNSVAFIPSGLMFQSDKGIWLLGRDLSTSYIGAAVEDFNVNLVMSALTIPATNQVRFKLDNGSTLMYDYFYNQWGEFTNSSAISSTLYQGLETYLNDRGQIYQETPGLFFDNTKPVLISFKSGWFNLAGLQGYERAYYFYMLAEFLSPHKVQIEIAYDYAEAPSQSIIIRPENYGAPYGGDPTYGYSTPYGGQGNLEQWRFFFQQQRCQSFEITLNEIYDPSYAISDNKGLTISGLNLVFGIKRGFRPINAKNSAG